MARKFTVEALTLRCRQLTDMENSEFISDAEWRSLLSTQYAELVAIVNASGMRVFEQTETVTADGTDTAGAFALPVDHFSTIGVDYNVDANGSRRQLEELMVQDRNSYTTSRGESRAWALVGQYLMLYPPPASGQTYRHVYLAHSADLTDASPQLQLDVVTPDGEGFLVWGVAVRALAKQDSDARLAQQEREAARERLQLYATMRALTNPRRIVSGGSDSYEEGDWRRGGW